MIHLRAMDYLGLDVGGTSIKIGRYNKDGATLSTNRIPTADWRGDFRQNLLQFLKGQAPVAGVGIGIPGLLSLDRRRATFVEVLPELDNQPFVSQLEEALPAVDFALENDAMCAALGIQFEQPVAGDTFLYVGLGTGLGSAAVLQGKPFLGGNGNALELGFVPADEGKWIEYHMTVGQQVQRLHKAGLVEATPRNFSAFLAKTELGIVQELRADLLRHLARGLAPAVVILDVHRLVCGGGNMPSDPSFLFELREVILEHLPHVYQDLALLPLEAGPFTAARGAASLVME